MDPSESADDTRSSLPSASPSSKKRGRSLIAFESKGKTKESTPKVGKRVVAAATVSKPQKTEQDYEEADTMDENEVGASGGAGGWVEGKKTLKPCHKIACVHAAQKPICFVRFNERFVFFSVFLSRLSKTVESELSDPQYHTCTISFLKNNNNINN